MIDLLLGPLGGALAGMAAIVVVFLTGRRGGAKSERLKASKRDSNNARDIENRADAARRPDGRTPDQRLRDHDGLRD